STSPMCLAESTFGQDTANNVGGGVYNDARGSSLVGFSTLTFLSGNQAAKAPNIFDQPDSSVPFGANPFPLTPQYSMPALIPVTSFQVAPSGTLYVLFKNGTLWSSPTGMPYSWIGYATGVTSFTIGANGQVTEVFYTSVLHQETASNGTVYTL